MPPGSIYLRAGALGLAGGVLSPRRALAGTPEPAGTLAGEWAADAGLRPRALTPEHRFTADFPVNAVMMHWARAGSAEDAAAEVSVGRDGRAWSAWLPAPVDEDADGRGTSARRYSAPVLVLPGRHLRVRIVDDRGQPGAGVADLRVSYLNTLAGPASAALAMAAAPDDTVPIIPRAAWGADENLRFRDGKEVWPREHQIPEKVILHHTETPNDQDPIAAIRAVYAFHAVTRGWGDIGYNYLVDAAGRIYEGRAGGEFVIADHTIGYNAGSIGIAVLGSFQRTALTPAAEDAIVRLVAGKARAVDPVGQSWFVDKVVPNIAGHRDYRSTSCPGQASYPRLPAIRERSLERIGYRPTPAAAIVDVRIGPTSLKTGERLAVRATVTNTGTAVLPSDQLGPGIVYVEGQDYAARGLPKVSGHVRLALEAAGAAGGRYPYRWGLGRSLLPGESVTVTGYVQLTQPQRRTFTVALVQEQVKYWQQEVGATRVRVTGPPITVPVPPSLAPPAPAPGPLPTDRRPAPAAPDPNRTYFAESGHYLGYGFRSYWEKHGDLAQFGYPLTEEFTERNPEDGKEYTVQYFERARFEYHPEHKGTQFEVLLGLLGKQVTAGRSFEIAPPGSKPPRDGARYFPETRQWVSGPILKYWTERGGLMTYGYPISLEQEEVNPDDGRVYLVQYFERNRLEYHPEHKGTPFEVQLGLLGRQVLVARGWLTR